MIIYYNTEFKGGRPESRRLLEKAFARHTGDPALATELISKLKTGDQGKPYIDGFCRFSVSHTGSVWAVLVDPEECGLDIQLGRKCDAKAIAARVFAPEDVARLTELSAKYTDADRNAETSADTAASRERDLFFRIWARREALAKALGGTAFDSALPPVLTGRAEVNGKVYTITDISFPDMPDLYAAVCFEERCAGCASDIQAVAELSFERLE